MHVTSSLSRERLARGFTLIELLVTLIVVSVGLLGVAKLQAAAIAETGVARTRSLMTFQAEALAAAMRSNRAFWQSSTAFTQSITIAAGGTVSQNPVTMTQPSTTGNTCVSTSACSASDMAWDDVTSWATAFGHQFPTASGTIVCTGAASTPETCDVTLTWKEHTVAVNRSTATAAAAASGVSENSSYMVLHIQP
jgi:type IV pilus assembly protein PilV